MTINQNLTQTNYNSGSGTGRIKYIVIHYTGNDGDTAWANTNFFKSENRGASAHYFVDENSIWQCVQDKDIAWHCGTDGAYKHPECRNTNSVGVEMCSRKYSGGTFFFREETVLNAVELVKDLMKRYGVPIKNIVRHYDVTGKVCPEPYVRSEAVWNEFKSMLTTTGGNVNGGGDEVAISEDKVREIAAAAAKTAVASYAKEQEKKNVSDWAKGFWSEAVSKGIFDGTMPQGNLTREQAATTYGKMGMLDMNRDREVSGWAKEAWDSAVRRGLVDGKAPQGPVTREMLMVILKKLGHI